MAKTSTLLVIALVAVVASFAAYFLLFSALSSSSQSRSVTLTLSEIREGEEGWVPSTIYLKKGEIVQLTVVNGDDEFEHSLAVPELGIQTQMIPPRNERITINFTADRTGTFLFNDPKSKPDCKPAPPEEVSKRDIAFRLEELIENLEESKSIEQAKSYIAQLQQVAGQYKQLMPAETAGQIADLEKAATLDEVMSLTAELDDAVNSFEASLAPPCIKEGQIIIEP